MNSYSPNLAVNTLLSLETVVEPQRDKPLDVNSGPQDSFGRILSEQDRPASIDPRRDTAQEKARREAADDTRPKPSVQDQSASRSESSNSVEADGSERQTIADSSEKNSHGEESGQQSSGEEGSEQVIDDASEKDFSEVDLSLAEDLENVISEIPEETVEPIDGETEALVEVEGVAGAAVITTAQEGVKVAEAKAAVVNPVPGELHSYRVNAAGKPFTTDTAAAEDKIELSLDLDSQVAKKADSSAVPLETKSAAKQLSQLVNLLGGGQPIVSTEQALKELVARTELPASRVADGNAVTGLSAAVSRSTAQTQASLLNNPANALQAQVKAGIGQPKWQTAISERVAFMASQNIKSAEIQLDPPELGPLQVRVTINQDQASVAFASHHAQVREALDQTAFRLRDMLQQEGMVEVNVDVSDQPFSQESGDGESRSGAGGDGTEPEADESQDVLVTARVSNSLVDHFV